MGIGKNTEKSQKKKGKTPKKKTDSSSDEEEYSEEEEDPEEYGLTEVQKKVSEIKKAIMQEVSEMP